MADDRPEVDKQLILVEGMGIGYYRHSSPRICGSAIGLCGVLSVGN